MQEETQIKLVYYRMCHRNILKLHGAHYYATRISKTEDARPPMTILGSSTPISYPVPYYSLQHFFAIKQLFLNQERSNKWKILV